MSKKKLPEFDVFTDALPEAGDYASKQAEQDAKHPEKMYASALYELAKLVANEDACKLLAESGLLRDQVEGQLRYIAYRVWHIKEG
jgi:hypothetical protein